jgi:hypothetical protein
MVGFARLGPVRCDTFTMPAPATFLFGDSLSWVTAFRFLLDMIIDSVQYDHEATQY